MDWPEPLRGESGLKIILLITVFIGLVFIRNLAFWSSSQTFVFGDTAIYSLQLASLAKNFGTILNPKDSLFLWNPNYLSVGLPTLSLVDYGLFYPANILIAALAHVIDQPTLVFPLYRISILLHLIFGSYFIYKILRVFWNLEAFSALIGALIWSYSGFNLEWIAAAPVLLAACYLPVCIYLSLLYARSHERKDAYLFYLFLSLSFLVGYPMISLIIYFFNLALSLFLYGKKLKTFLGQFLKDQSVGVFLILLPIILPLYFSSFSNLSYSVRSQLRLESFLQNPASAFDLLEPFLPKDTFFNTLNRINSVYLYFSLVGLLILFQSKIVSRILRDPKNVVLVIIGVVGLVFSLGSATFLPSLAYFMLPGIGLFRRLSIFSFVPNTVFALLVAQVVVAALKNKSFSKANIFWFKLLTILFLYAKILNILYASQEPNPFNTGFLYQSLFVTIVITAVSGLAFFYARTNQILARSILLAAVLLEAGTSVSSKVYLNSKVDPAKIFQPDRLTNELQRIVKPMERIDLLASQHSYSTDYLNLEQTQGYLSLASRYGVEINEALNSSDYNKKNLRQLLGIGYVVKKGSAGEGGFSKATVISQEVSHPEFFSYNYLTQAWETEETGTSYSILRNEDILPRIFLAKEVRTTEVQTRAEIRKIETYESPRIVTISKRDDQGQILDDTGEVTIKEYRRNYLKAEVASSSYAFLANSTAYYPGWSAKINGQIIKPIQTNWFMMGVYLPPGVNIVEFFYVAPGLLVLGGYFLLCLIFWIVVIYGYSRKSKALSQ